MEEQIGIFEELNIKFSKVYCGLKKDNILDSLHINIIICHVPSVIIFDVYNKNNHKKIYELINIKTRKKLAEFINENKKDFIITTNLKFLLSYYNLDYIGFK